MEVAVPVVTVVDKAPALDESSAAKVGRFVSEWVAPILRKVVSSSESRQEGSETSPRGRPRNQGDASGRGQGCGQGRRQGRGSGRRQRNRGC
jgi:hypothetical protein